MFPVCPPAQAMPHLVATELCKDIVFWPNSPNLYQPRHVDRACGGGHFLGLPLWGRREPCWDLCLSVCPSLREAGGTALKICGMNVWVKNE